jgi:prepilin-type N-terminal cleavage/methylation domain-containing protein
MKIREFSKFKYKKGFTLIELLLVIAIISILAAVGIMSYRRYFQVNRIDKVAISIQHVLEGAMAFYVDKSEWPADRDCDGSGGDIHEFVDNYLPNANYKSYYGTDFCWEKAGDTSKLFWVAVKIPGDGTDNLNVAKRLAARLPNAIVTSTPDSDDSPAPACDATDCYVRAEITVPGVSSNAQQSVSLAATGDCHPGVPTPNASRTGSCTDASSGGQQQYSISFKACSANATPNLRINPNYVVVPRSHNGYNLVGMNATPGTCTTTPDAQGKETCPATLYVSVCTPNGRHDCSESNIKSMGGQVGASYLITCISNNSRGSSSG